MILSESTGVVQAGGLAPWLVARDHTWEITPPSTRSWLKHSGPHGVMEDESMKGILHWFSDAPASRRMRKGLKRKAACELLEGRALLSGGLGMMPGLGVMPGMGMRHAEVAGLGRSGAGGERHFGGPRFGHEGASSHGRSGHESQSTADRQGGSQFGGHSHGQSGHGSQGAAGQQGGSQDGGHSHGRSS